MSQVRGRMLFAVLAITGMAAAGCGGTSEQIDRVAATATPEMSTPEMGTGTPGASPTGAAADVERVGTVALHAVPDSEVVSMNASDDEKSWYVWVASKDGEKHKMTIDSMSGKVTQGPEAQKSSDEEKSKTQELVKAAKIDYAEAAGKMLTEFPGGRLTKLKLTMENAETLWKGTVEDAQKAEHKVAVNAVTGEMVAPTGTMSPGETGGESPTETGTMMPSPTES